MTIDSTKQIVRKAVEKAVREVYKEHYPMHRRGAFDFPDEEEWVKEQVKLFKRNFPELLGFHGDMDTQENNKLIAEFMGTLTPMYKDNFGVQVYYNPADENDKYSEFYATQFKYYKEWNWLMPVVEKIETIDRGDEKGKFLLHFNSNSVNWNNTPPTITGINKKHSVYKAVVQFIKWYNQNKED